MLSFLVSLVSTKDEIVDMLVFAVLVAPNIEIYVLSRLKSMFDVYSRAVKFETRALAAQYANLAARQAIVVEIFCCEEKCSQRTCQPQFCASDLAVQVTSGMINCCR